MEDLEFRVDTVALLHEIADCALKENMGVLKIPLNVFKNLLVMVAKRAIELDDKELHILMLKLGLYEVHQQEIGKTIGILRNQINQNDNNPHKN